jgi:hypothetical protein
MESETTVGSAESNMERGRSSAATNCFTVGGRDGRLNLADDVGMLSSQSAGKTKVNEGVALVD